MNKMFLKRLALIILLLFQAHPVLSEALPQSDQVQRLGSEFVNADHSDGLSIALITAGKVTFHNFGSVSRQKPQSPTEHTVYEIGSISKVFTSLLLAHAVTAGKINLNDDVRHYLSGDYPNLTWNGKPVRVLHLANATSALPDNLPDFSTILAGVAPEKGPALLTRVLTGYRETDLLRDLKTVKLVDEPGTLPRHSNLAAELLGVILQQTYGQTYQSLLASYVEQPFGMLSGIGEARSALLATGYNSQHIAMPPTNQASIMAAGGLRYSTSDMARFIDAELAAQSKPIQLSQQPAWGDPSRAALAFNWNITENVEGQLRLHASGGTLGGASYIELYPRLGYGIVLLANRSGETESLLQDLAENIFEAVMGSPALDDLRTSLQAAGYVDAGKVIAAVRHRHPELHLTEQYVTQWAGGLLSSNHPQAAVGLFEYNAAQWPHSSDALESLGYGYESLGDKKRAASAYRIALKLDPRNGEARDGLKKLTAGPQ